MTIPTPTSVLGPTSKQCTCLLVSTRSVSDQVSISLPNIRYLYFGGVNPSAHLDSVNSISQHILTVSSLQLQLMPPRRMSTIHIARRLAQPARPNPKSYVLNHGVDLRTLPVLTGFSTRQWTFNRDTNELIAQWVNTDGSKSSRALCSTSSTDVLDGLSFGGHLSAMPD